MLRMTIDVYFYWLLILKVRVLRVKKIYIPFFIRGQKSAIMDEKCWGSKISEIGLVTTHSVGNFMLIKNQVRT